MLILKKIKALEKCKDKQYFHLDCELFPTLARFSSTSLLCCMCMSMLMCMCICMRMCMRGCMIMRVRICRIQMYSNVEAPYICSTGSLSHFLTLQLANYLGRG
jgi:hypothetical protein